MDNIGKTHTPESSSQSSSQSSAPVLATESGPCSGCNNPVLATSGPHRGLGDTVASVIDVTGLGVVAALYKKITGKDCNCKTRQEALNKLVPYGIKEAE